LVDFKNECLKDELQNTKSEKTFDVEHTIEDDCQLFTIAPSEGF
jgi:hypothetical protein